MQLDVVVPKVEVKPEPSPATTAPLQSPPLLRDASAASTLSVSSALSAASADTAPSAESDSALNTELASSGSDCGSAYASVKAERRDEDVPPLEPCGDSLDDDESTYSEGEDNYICIASNTSARNNIAVVEAETGLQGRAVAGSAKKEETAVKQESAPPMVHTATATNVAVTSSATSATAGQVKRSSSPIPADVKRPRGPDVKPPSDARPPIEVKPERALTHKREFSDSSSTSSSSSSSWSSSRDSFSSSFGGSYDTDSSFSSSTSSSSTSGSRSERGFSGDDSISYSDDEGDLVRRSRRRYRRYSTSSTSSSENTSSCSDSDRVDKGKHRGQRRGHSSGRSRARFPRCDNNREISGDDTSRDISSGSRSNSASSSNDDRDVDDSYYFSHAVPAADAVFKDESRSSDTSDSGSINGNDDSNPNCQSSRVTADDGTASAQTYKSESDCSRILRELTACDNCSRGRRRRTSRVRPTLAQPEVIYEPLLHPADDPAVLALRDRTLAIACTAKPGYTRMPPRKDSATAPVPPYIRRAHPGRTEEESRAIWMRTRRLISWKNETVSLRFLARTNQDIAVALAAEDAATQKSGGRVVRKKNTATDDIPPGLRREFSTLNDDELRVVWAHRLAKADKINKKRSLIRQAEIDKIKAEREEKAKEILQGLQDSGKADLYITRQDRRDMRKLERFNGKNAGSNSNTKNDQANNSRGGKGVNERNKTIAPAPLRFTQSGIAFDEMVLERTDGRYCRPRGRRTNPETDPLPPWLQRQLATGTRTEAQIREVWRKMLMTSEIANRKTALCKLVGVDSVTGSGAASGSSNQNRSSPSSVTSSPSGNYTADSSGDTVAAIAAAAAAAAAAHVTDEFQEEL